MNEIRRFMNICAPDADDVPQTEDIFSGLTIEMTTARMRLREAADLPPVVLYHGTSTARLRSIDENGLVPQRSRDNAERVGIYLTDRFENACDYAELACIRDEDAGTVARGTAEMLVLEIDSASLDANAFAPDDHELRDAMAGREAYHGLPRDPHLHAFDRWSEVPWLTSLAVVGQILYESPIPRSAIRIRLP